MLAHRRGVPSCQYLKFLSTAPDGTALTSPGRYAEMFKKDLHSRCDGRGLRQSALVPQPLSWVSDGSSFMSGRDYIAAYHIRYNCLYPKSRAARGRETSHLCSRGCSESEALNHILQKCYATHRLRINRHDQLCNYLSRSLLQRGYSVQQEPVLESPDGSKLKPDLVASSTNHTVLIDFQVVNDQFPWRSPTAVKFPSTPAFCPSRSVIVVLM